MRFLDLFAAFLTFISFAFAITPGSCSGACNVHDPAVIRRTSDGTYFRFSTGNRIQIATAPSLAGPWTIQGSAIPAGSIINLDGRYDLWAPDVIKVGNYYYLYYSVSTFGSQNSAIGVARSTTMNVGTWADLGPTGITSITGSAYNAIDANLIATGGNYYMTFGSFWTDIYQVQMPDPPVRAFGFSSYQVAYNSTGAHAIEGATVFKHSGYFYLFFSSGTCCGYDRNRPSAGNEYRINVCRSASVAGPYVDARGKPCRSGGGTTVLASQGWLYGPGGQGVFADTNSGGTILYYHYVDTRIGYGDGQKRFGWSVLSWSGGWPKAT